MEYTILFAVEEEKYDFSLSVLKEIEFDHEIEDLKAYAGKAYVLTKDGTIYEIGPDGRENRVSCCGGSFIVKIGDKIVSGNTLTIGGKRFDNVVYAESSPTELMLSLKGKLVHYDFVSNRFREFTTHDLSTDVKFRGFRAANGMRVYTIRGERMEVIKTKSLVLSVAPMGSLGVAYSVKGKIVTPKRSFSVHGLPSIDAFGGIIAYASNVGLRGIVVGKELFMGPTLQAVGRPLIRFFSSGRLAIALGSKLYITSSISRVILPGTYSLKLSAEDAKGSKLELMERAMPMFNAFKEKPVWALKEAASRGVLGTLLEALADSGLAERLEQNVYLIRTVPEEFDELNPVSVDQKRASSVLKKLEAKFGKHYEELVYPRGIALRVPRCRIFLSPRTRLNRSAPAF